LKKRFLFVVIIICFFYTGIAQELKVVSSKKEYKNSIAANGNNTMVDIKKLIPSVVLDLRYHTANNFMRKEPAAALLNAQAILKAKGYGIKIFDAYRPYSVTKRMWELIHDERYVANPAGGSGHNRGTSIDLTIINLSTGIELDMGTAFDNFTDSAQHSFTPKLSAQIIENRNLLENVMKELGFKRLETEWWHYSWICKEPFPVLDFDFKTMRKLSTLSKK
jgi:zinc D-Ala-D-Ala dipeptidase